MYKTTNEIRDAFLAYFNDQGHQIIPSGPLVPIQDPTLMFANAGMVQFKNVFLGRQKRPAPRVATVQKCIRISGKHNDLENVGRTSRHHTFFEMLGNFSFGDYFKEDACLYAWDFLTGKLGFDPNRLFVSVFQGDASAPRDEDAIRIWRDRVGVPMDRILEGTAADNFWSMGDTGPCGPCSEIMFDRGADFGEASLDNGERFFEIWNLVFMQYMVEEKGDPMKPLPVPCIDTGAGLERIVSVLQHVDSNYDIDVFQPLVAMASTISGKPYGQNDEDDVSMRVIADHARMAAQLISEGIFPEKSGREYVLRRVMRRAIRHGHRLGIGDLFFHRITMAVVTAMGKAYPELTERRELIERVCMQEEERFRATLSRGLWLLSENTEWRQTDDGRRLLPGALAFDLSATYGFPLDLIEVIGQEDGFLVDAAEYEEARCAHRVVSGAGKIGDQAVPQSFRDVRDAQGPTDFIGYDATENDARVVAIIVNGEQTETIGESEEGSVVLDRTPFYGESGGQIGDMGQIAADHCTATVQDVTRPVEGLIAHHVRVEKGDLSVGQTVHAGVNRDRRQAVARHHTATHLLHYAIRRILGPHATQKGSRVAHDSLRFDFTHTEALSAQDIRELERIVATLIMHNLPVCTVVTPLEEARASGAMALFEENYGEEVRLVSVGDKSRELCGGTHVARSGDIGPFCILSENGVAAGVRRIEAVCGQSAVAWLADQRNVLHDVCGLLKIAPTGLMERVDRLIQHEKDLLRQIEKLKRDVASGDGTEILSKMKEIDGVRVIGATLGIGDPATLRETVDQLRQKIGSGIICLGGDNNGKASVIVAVTRDLTERFQAGALIRDVASVVGGRGGGRPELAQAGGTDVSRIEEAVSLIYEQVRRAAER